MIINREWAMPNRYTFKVKPIMELLKRHVGNGNGWIDPFAGKTSPAEITNDIDETMPTQFHQDALTFLKSLDTEKYNGAIYDPPFNPVQARWCYEGGSIYKRNYEFHRYMTKCRKEVSRVVRPGGMVISCGFNSGGIGKRWGFKIMEILLIAHGGTRNDTIVTVERKVQSRIDVRIFGEKAMEG